MRNSAVVIGGGTGGLAVSCRLTARSIDHVVLERGEVANSWRTERWDSLRLLTPNWQCRLPGWDYDGDEPDGFMTMPEVVNAVGRYAVAIAAPVRTGTTVTSVAASNGEFVVRSDSGEWRCDAVVIATGAFNRPNVPDFAAAVPDGVEQVTPHRYRSAAQLPDGEVLVVGASATGVQIAHEIQQSGRPVTLAVGEHVRARRTYRGRDIQWWMEASGRLDESYEEVDDIVRARRVPSMQITGSTDRYDVDLNALTETGVKLVGRLGAVRDGRAQFSGSLPNKCALADLKLGRLLDEFDDWAREAGIDDEVSPPHRFEPTRVEHDPLLGVNLKDGRIRAIVWATGFRPDYSWLDLPVLDRKGFVRHNGGVGEMPGVYVIGLPFLRRRKSSFIDGAKADSQDLVRHLAAHLDRTTRMMSG